MIDDLRPYAEMKPTGLPWMGDVPAHWEVLRSGSVFREVVQNGFPDLELLSIKSGVGIVRQSSTGRKVRASEDRSQYKRISPGWLGYNLMNAFFGGIGMSRYEGILSPAYAVASPKFEIHPKFFQYLYHSPLYLTQFNRESFGIMYERNRLYFDRFRRIEMIVPPLEEQRLIVRYLDWHGGQVARLVRAKKALIGLLNEQKQAIIHRAVTRGLDPNAKLKASGIPWLGDVPDRWEVKPVRRFASVINGYPFDSAQFSTASGFPLIRIRDLNKETASIHWSGEFVPEAAVFRGDTLIGMDGDFNVGTWNGVEPAQLNQRMCCVRPTDRRFASFLHLALAIPLRALNDIANSTTVKHLSSWQVDRIQVALPPVEECVEVVAAIDEKTLALDAALGVLHSEITLIKEFRTRLIADVVTGKLDVRPLAASLPETASEDIVDDLAEDEDLDELPEESDTEEAAA